MKKWELNALSVIQSHQKTALNVHSDVRPLPPPSQYPWRRRRGTASMPRVREGISVGAITKPTPCSRVLKEKRTAPKMVTRYPAFYGTRISLPHSQKTPSSLWLLRTIVEFLRCEIYNTSPNRQSGGPPLVGCPRLLILYIPSYVPCLEAVPPTATWGRAMPWR